LQDGADTPVGVQDALATLRILELAHEMSA
jgi:hypothetical protein